jgi:hypothetical protein
MWRRKMKKTSHFMYCISLILLSGLSISEKNKRFQNSNNVQYMVDPGGMG